MNPYDHARSSARRHGGAWTDYHPLHGWFDASKATLCHFTHRAIHHHHEGVAEAVRMFGPTVRNKAGDEISTETLAIQHIEEDCPFVPSAADWLVDFRAPDWLPSTWPGPDELAAASARRFGGTSKYYLPLHHWFLETSAWAEGSAHLLFRHHAFGIFEAEQLFSPAIGNGSGAMPTRVIAEQHVRTVVGRIPSAADYLRRITGQRWMLQATSPTKLGLDQDRPAEEAFV
jgi:hypothetical protein